MSDHEVPVCGPRPPLPADGGPLSLDPRWRTETALALATGIDVDRAFDRLPILADALEDAGCDLLPLLAHCRHCPHHTPDCWAVAVALDRVPPEPPSVDPNPFDTLRRAAEQRAAIAAPTPASPTRVLVWRVVALLIGFSVAVRVFVGLIYPSSRTYSPPTDHRFVQPAPLTLTSDQQAMVDSMMTRKVIGRWNSVTGQFEPNTPITEKQ